MNQINSLLQIMLTYYYFYFVLSLLHVLAPQQWNKLRINIRTAETQHIFRLETAHSDGLHDLNLALEAVQQHIG